MKKRALVIDDEPAICQALAALLSDLDCDATMAATAEQALVYAEKEDFDVIVLDVRLPGMDGLEALPKFKQLGDAPVLLITAHGDLSTAVSAVERGAFEYLPKPFDLESVTTVLTRALTSRQPADVVSSPRNYSGTQLIGNSRPMQTLFRQIAQAAQHNEPVLITGESGTGKELIAHAIHEHSSRKSQPIVPVHLASLSDALMERELFGHVAGAYTGATASQQGLIARANGGTLFLDEIGETPSPVQVKLLRTIETREFYPVGSSAPEVSDFRLVAATNRSMEFLQSAENFRQDLFFRLSTIHIQVPPLRERRDDIPILAEFLLNHSPNQPARELSDGAIDKLMAYDFPGNVRELKNIILRAAATSAEATISADYIVLDAGGATGATAATLQIAAQNWARNALTAGQTSLLAGASEIVERELIVAALEHCSGNRSAAASILGIHRETLRDKLTKMSDESE